MDLIDHFFEHDIPYGGEVSLIYDDKYIGYFSVLNVKQNSSRLVGLYDYNGMCHEYPQYKLETRNTIEIYNKIIYDIKNHLGMTILLYNCVVINTL